MASISIIWLIVVVNLVSGTTIDTTDSGQRFSCSVTQRTLQVLAIINPPYTYENEKMMGIDTLILNTIAKKLNFSVKLHKVNEFNSNSLETNK